MRAPIVDYYAVLGVARDARPAELRRAYRVLALRFHPDRAGIQSTEVFQRIAQAYGVLSDAAARDAFDATLRATESRRPGRPSDSAPGTKDGDPAPWTDISQGDVYGPGGKISWRRGGRDPHRVDDLIDRLCGPLDGLIARGIARQVADGFVELNVGAGEAARGGTAAIDTAIEMACPTCLGGARPGRLWCRRCDYVGTVREVVTVCIPIAVAISDGAVFNVATDPAGRAAPLRVRIRVV